jgi:hypothetical protein
MLAEEQSLSGAEDLRDHLINHHRRIVASAGSTSVTSPKSGNGYQEIVIVIVMLNT